MGGVYTKIEDVFYGAMDFLEEKGIPVYAVIDPLEEHGIPAFPFAVFLALVVGFLVFGVFLAPQEQLGVTLNIVDSASNDAVGNVSLEIRDKDNRVVSLEGNTFSNGQKVFLSGVSAGEELKFTFSKNGYADKTIETKLDRGSANLVSVQLFADRKIIDGLLKFVDAKTLDEVKTANVIAALSDRETVPCNYYSPNRAFVCSGVIEGSEVRLSITSSNYEGANFQTKFYDGSAQTIELEPKGEASVGSSNLIIRVVDGGSNQLVQNAGIKIFDASDDGLISEFSDEDGELLTQVDKGTSVRIVVQADGYVRYDSGVLGQERTLRNDEELWEVPLRMGGTTVEVAVTDLSGLPQSFAAVQLFNENLGLIDSKETSLGGTVFFDDLGVEEIFTATAFKEGFLPVRKTFSPGTEQQVTLELEALTQANSSRVEVFVVEKGGVGANNASVSLYEIVGGKEQVLGFPPLKTDINGKLAVYVKNGTVILARATKGTSKGEAQTEVVANRNNDLLVELFNTAGIVAISFVDASGEKITAGHVKIESIEGDRLEELDLESLAEGEEIVFDALENEFVKVTFTDLAGKTFTEEINVKDSESVQMTINSSNSAQGIAPTVAFTGITSISGEKVEGVIKGEPYYLVFEAVFPEGPGKNGFHARVGDDTIKHADSDEVGITGFSSDASGHFYGRTFSALPEPGSEGIDFSNQGSAGNYNKFLELYFDSGGTKIIKVKVQAKETTSEPKFLFHFRAWSQFGADFYRAPKDDVLNFASFAVQKSGLYAATNDEEVKIFEAKSVACKKDFCVSYKFLEENGSEFELKDFKAVKEKNYAIVVELNPSVDIEATVKVSTSKSAPKIFFQGYAVENASIFPDNNRLDTSLDITGIVSPAEKSVRVLVFFKTVDLGNVSMTVQTVTADDVITDSIFFEVFEEKELSVSTKPQQVLFGDDFSFEVKEMAGGAPVENVMIVLRDADNRHLQTIVGNGSTDRGADGEYLVKNSFDTGIIRYEISAPGFTPADGEVQVFKKGILSLPEEIIVSIPRNPPTATRKVELVNTSPDLLSDVSIEVQRKPNFASGMNVRATTLGLIEPNSSQPITITADYSGTEDRAQAEATIIATGRVNGKYLARAQSKLILQFNPELPLDCIEFSKAQLVIFVESGFDNRNNYNDIYERQFYNPQSQSYQYGQQPQNNEFGLTDELGRTESRYLSPYNRFFGSSNTKKVDLTIRNKCDVEIELFPEVVPRVISDNEGINVNINSVKLKPAGTVQSGRRLDEQKVDVSVTNSLLRNYPQMKTFSFDVFFNSDALSKSLPLDVIIWSPRFSLDFTRNIELWLAQENPSQPARAVAPLFLRNIGQAPVENVNFRVASTTQGGSVNLRIQPAFPIEFLQPGQSVNPPKTVVAEATRTEKSTPIDVKRIDVFGLIDGRTQEFGPIFVTSHVSGVECLKVSPNSIDFFSEKTTGVLSRTIKAKSTCSEDIRVSGVSPNQFGANVLNAAFGEVMIQPGQEISIELILTKRESWQAQTPVYLDGLLVRSNRFIRSNPINLDLRLGEEALQPSIAFDEKTIPVCFSEETKKVKFPKIAVNDNCETAYCDAEQLSVFLVKKGAEKLNAARREINNYKSDIVNTNCGEEGQRSGECSFDNLNVKQETFTVFLSNDSLTPELLKKSAEKNAKEIAGFNYDYLIPVGPNSTPQIGQIGKKILLSNSVAGCGKYRVRIDGKVKLIGTKIDGDLVNIYINLSPEGSDFAPGEEEEISELTEQCLPKIQNFANFLPSDKGFESVESASGAWPAVIEPQKPELADTAKEIAKKMFGTENRGVRSTANTSRLVLDFGSPENYLVKVEMQKTQEDGPRKITALVQQVQSENAATRTEVLNEAGQAIAALKNNSVDGCISANEDFFLLKSAATVRGLELELGACVDNSTQQKDKLSVMVGQETCCTLTVSSEIKEKVKVETLLVNRTGISEPLIKQNGMAVKEIELAENKTGAAQNSSQQNSNPRSPTGAQVLPATPPADQNKPPQPPAQPVPAPTPAPPQIPAKPVNVNKFKAQVQLCVSGLPDAQSAHGKPIEVTATATLNTERKTPKKDVSLQFCGLHPDDLWKQLDSLKEPGDYYFTPVWDGDERSSIPLSEVLKLAENAAHLKDAKSIDAASLSSQTAIESDQKTKRLEGLGVYLVTCGVVSGLYGLKFGFGAIGGVIFDCGIPAASAAAEVLDGPREAKKWLIEGLQKIPVIGSIAKWLGGGVDAAGDKVAGIIEKDPQRIEDTELDSLTNTALTSVGAYSIYHGFTDATGIIGPLSARAAATQVSNQMAEEFMRRNFGTLLSYRISRIGGLAYPIDADLRKLYATYRDAMREQTFLSLRKYYGGSFDTPLGEEGAAAFQRAVAESIEPVAKDSKVLADFAAVTDKLIDRTTKDVLKKANEEALEGIVKSEPLAKAAADSGVVKKYPVELTASRKNFSATDLKNIKDGVIKKLSESYYGEMEKEFKDKVGKEFLADPAKAATAKSQLENGIKNYINSKDIKPITNTEYLDEFQSFVPKGAPGAGNPIYKKVTFIKDAFLEITDADARNAAKAGISEVMNGTLKSEIEKGVYSRVSKETVKSLSEGAAQFISREKGVPKIKWTKFRSFLRGMFTKTFWKDMLKGGLGGIVSNAVGLGSYKFFMDKWGRPKEPDFKFNDAVPVDGVAVKADNVELQKFKPYKIVVGKDGRKSPPVIVDPKSIPEGAKWMNKCSESVVAPYQGLSNFLPDAAVFKAKKLPESIPASVKYLEGIGRILKGLDTEKNYGAPEALVVTAGIMHSKLGTDSAEWITGCKFGNPLAKNAPESLACAARELGNDLKSSECASLAEKEKTICALKKYNSTQGNRIIQNPDYEKLYQTFAAWNGMKRAA